MNERNCASACHGRMTYLKMEGWMKLGYVVLKDAQIDLGIIHVEQMIKQKKWRIK